MRTFLTLRSAVSVIAPLETGFQRQPAVGGGDRAIECDRARGVGRTHQALACWPPRPAQPTPDDSVILPVPAPVLPVNTVTLAPASAVVRVSAPRLESLVD